MHEGKMVLQIVIVITFFSAIITVEHSFAQTVQCNGLDATHVGTEDRDKIRGTSGDDVIVGLGGNDSIYGKGGNDVICGGEGNDKLFGSSGNDILIGEKGSDKLYGGQGIDTCDSSSDDKRVISCETPYIGAIVSDASEDVQKQIANLQDQLNSMILGLISWSDIQGIPESLADGDDDMLGNIKCDAEQTLVFDGNSWVCNDILVEIQTNSDCNGDLVNFAGLSHGANLNQIQEKLDPFGITLSATGNGEDSLNTVIIYDSNIDDGKDSDLEVGIGNLAIIPDNLQNPSDSAKGGIQEYSFDSPITLESIKIVDIESDEAGTLAAYDEDGKMIKSLNLPETGNKAYKTLKVDAPQVSSLKVKYSSSGALTDICISDIEENDPNDLVCEENQIQIFDGNSWICGDIPSEQHNDILSQLNCNTGEIIKMNGESWECSVDEKGSESPQENSMNAPIFFHPSLIAFGGEAWVGTAKEVFTEPESDSAKIVLPSSGTLKDLLVKTGDFNGQSPGLGESYSVILIKNGVETTVTCAIVDTNDNCTNQSSIQVTKGDTIVLKIIASGSAPFATVIPSIIYELS